VDRDATISAGSELSESRSGIGSSHSGRGAPDSRGSANSVVAGPSPDGSTRGFRRATAVRQTLVAIRYIQARTDERASNDSQPRQARR
jgi:hypothetical protein